MMLVWAELLRGYLNARDPYEARKASLTSVMVTDCKSFYDAI